MRSMSADVNLSDMRGMVAPMNRPAAVAGTWYPGTPGALAREVDEYLAAVGALPAGRIDAIIAPHAGIMFSGPVAAYAYKIAAARDRTTPPSSSGRRISSPSTASRSIRHGAFESLSGPATIAESLGADLLAASTDRPAVARPRHRREHSLEMQLPFLKRLLPDLPIVPLLIGYQTRDTIERLADALGRLATRAPPPARCQQRSVALLRRPRPRMSLDQRVRECVADFDAARLLELFEQYPEGERGRYVACGGGAIIAVMLAARARGAATARILRYAHSGEISGDNEGVVGYLAAACGAFFDVH